MMPESVAAAGDRVACPVASCNNPELGQAWHTAMSNTSNNCRKRQSILDGRLATWSQMVVYSLYSRCVAVAGSMQVVRGVSVMVRDTGVWQEC